MLIMKKFYKFFEDKNVLIFGIFILLFLILKISFMAFKFSDENIYFFMAKLITQGQLPYRDFFFASPPLQLSVLFGLLFLVNSKIILLKLIPLIASVITASIIFLYVKKKFNSNCALLSSILYLFSFIILTTTDYSTGVHLTSMFFMISFYLVHKQKYFLGGIISSLALLTRLYVAFAIVGIGIYLLIKNWKKFVWFALGISVIFIPVNLILLFLFKENYLTSVFLYHFLKTEGILKLGIFRFFIKWDFTLIILTISSLFLKTRKSLKQPLIVAGAISLFYVFYSDVYYLYFGVLIPFLAICAGVVLGKIKERKKEIAVVLMILVLCLVIFNSAFYVKNHALTSKIEFLDEISEYIKANSLENQTIYGDFEIAPLVAMVSERKIINNYIDTNEKTFLTGLYNIEERTNLLKGKVKFVILKVFMDSNNKIISTEQIINKTFLSDECTLVKTYNLEKDYGGDNAVVLFDCLPKL